MLDGELPPGEDLWRFGVLQLLDDYESLKRHRGVQVASEVLAVEPQRTAAFLIAYPDVEQIARVLPVERRNSLAGIDLRGGNQAGSNTGREQVLGGWVQVHHPWRQDAATEDLVDLDLDLHLAIGHQ